MRRFPRIAGFLLVAACPKVGTPASHTGAVVVEGRVPVQCTQVRKAEGLSEVEVLPPTGCNASVRFRLEPTGYRDVALPFFRDAIRATSTGTLSGGRVLDRTMLLRDPAGENIWSAEISDSDLPWTSSGRCARPADPNTFDATAWRFLVVRVRTRDTLGTSRPIAETQVDTLTLTIQPAGAGAGVKPRVTASTTHDGVWGAVWCADDADGPYTLDLDVHGAYQLEADRFEMPAPGADTYTFLDYTVRPVASEGAR